MSRLSLIALGLSLAAVASAQQPDAVEKQILTDVNAYREKNDLPKLSLDKKLEAIAQAHARGMAKLDKYGDDDKNGHFFDGKGPKERVEDAKYDFRLLGENVGWNVGEKDPADAIFRMWLKSEPHEKNIAHKGFTHLGLGAAKSKSGKWYFVQLFAKPAGGK